MKSSNFRDIEPLLKLLDDESEEIFSVIKQKLIEKGRDIIPFIHEFSEKSDEFLKNRIKLIIEEINSKSIKQQLENLIESSQDDIDLERGALLIAKYGYPNLELAQYSEILNHFANKLDSKLGSHDDPLEVISIINKYFFQELGFRGNKENYYDPENSYLNRVIDRRLGIPITLSTIYLLIAKRLNIPLYGIGMPSHFLLKYETLGLEVFLDPFNNGQLLSKSDCINFLIEAGRGFKEIYLEKNTNRQILTRMVRNLILIYQKQGQEVKIKTLGIFLETIELKGKI